MHLTSVQKTASFTPGLTYYLQFYCPENFRQKVLSSGRHDQQNESGLPVCAVTAWRKNEDRAYFPSPDVADEVDRCESAAYLIGQYGQLVVYTLLDRKPAQLLSATYSNSIV